MQMSNWVKALKGDFSGFKKEKREPAKISDDKIYRLQWANGQRTNLVDHDEAVREINRMMNITGWNWVKAMNTATKKQQVVHEPSSPSGRGFLHLKKLNEDMLSEVNIPAGSWVWVKPTGNPVTKSRDALIDKSYPAANWIKTNTKVLGFMV